MSGPKVTVPWCGESKVEWEVIERHGRRLDWIESEDDVFSLELEVRNVGVEGRRPVVTVELGAWCPVNDSEHYLTAPLTPDQADAFAERLKALAAKARGASR